MKIGNQTISISYLLVQIGKLRRNKSNILLADAGIHEGQDILLYYLSLEEGQTISSLAEKMCNRPATVSTTIDRMIVAGLITKEQDKADKRTSRIFLTQPGKEAYKKVKRIWKEMEARIVSNLTDEELHSLGRILSRIQMNLS